MSFDTSRLYATLLTSKLQQDNPALYQVIYQLIGALSGVQKVITALGSSSSSSGTSEVITNIFQILQGSEGNGDNQLTIPGERGTQGLTGITGATGAIGPVAFIEDGIDGNDGFNIPVPGAQGIQGNRGNDGAAIYIVEDPPEPDVPMIPGPAGPTGSSGSNKLVQVVNTETGAVATGGTVIPLDDTIPQSTEGDQYMTLAITPTSATNKLKIDVVFFATSNAANWITAALFQDATANALAAFSNYQNIAGGGCSVTFTHYMTAGTTSSTTFKVRGGRDASAGTTITFNGTAAARLMGGVMASSITISEIVP